MNAAEPRRSSRIANRGANRARRSCCSNQEMATVNADSSVGRERMWSRLGTHDDLQIESQSDRESVGQDIRNATGSENTPLVAGIPRQNRVSLGNARNNDVHAADSLGSDGIFPVQNRLNDLTDSMCALQNNASLANMRFDKIEKSVEALVLSNTQLSDSVGVVCNAALAKQVDPTPVHDNFVQPIPSANKVTKPKPKSGQANKSVCFPMIINKSNIEGSIDLGFPTSIVSHNVYKSLPKKLRPSLRSSQTRLNKINGARVKVYGSAKFDVKIDSDKLQLRLAVVDSDSECILGYDFAQNHNKLLLALLAPDSRNVESDVTTSDDNSSSESVQSVTSESSDDKAIPIVTKHSKNKVNSVKLANFDGTEKWPTYKNRFEVMVLRRGWSNEEKLDQLLPRMTGLAAEFVYSQLPKSTLSNYKKLVKELDSRYVVVEIPKNFQNQFDKRNQEPYESYEAYSVELKRLYDKAYPTRPASIREQDLLKRFLNGLRDDKVRRAVEFVKRPKSIDKALVQAINYTETGGSRRRETIGKVNTSPVDDSSSDDEHVNRVPNAVKPSRDRTPTEQPTSTVTETVPANLAGMISEGVNAGVTEGLAKIMQQGWVTMANNNSMHYNRQNVNVNPNQGHNNNSGAGPSNRPPRSCYNCGQVGHFANRCPLPRQNNNNNQQANNSQAPPNQAALQQAQVQAIPQLLQNMQPVNNATAGSSN